MLYYIANTPPAADSSSISYVTNFKPNKPPVNIAEINPNTVIFNIYSSPLLIILSIFIDIFKFYHAFNNKSTVFINYFMIFLNFYFILVNY